MGSQFIDLFKGLRVTQQVIDNVFLGRELAIRRRLRRQHPVVAVIEGIEVGDVAKRLYPVLQTEHVVGRGVNKKYWQRAFAKKAVDIGQIVKPGIACHGYSPAGVGVRWGFSSAPSESR